MSAQYVETRVGGQSAPTHKPLRPNALSTCIFALCLMSLAGCATVSFKRGAGPGAMAADESACREISTGEDAYLKCMRDRGWAVSGGGGVSESEGAAHPVNEPIPDRSPPRTAPEDGEALRPTPGTAAEPLTAEPPIGEPTNPKPPPSAAAMPVEVDPRKADPSSSVDVASWWKLGGNPADLDRAIEACVTKLGSAHRPAAGARTVTVGMRDCLREAGWRPLGGRG